MKTIDQFSAECGKKPSTVRAWIARGYIPGANENGIPNSARIPYTEARSRGGKSLLKSILKGCSDGKGIVPELFGISNEQFIACIDYLEHDGYIYSYQEDGVMYYNTTMKGEESLKTFTKSQWIALCGAATALFPVLYQILSGLIH